jgi:hypothetical protein
MSTCKHCLHCQATSAERAQTVVYLRRMSDYWDKRCHEPDIAEVLEGMARDIDAGEHIAPVECP